MTEQGSTMDTFVLDKIPIILEPEIITKHLRMRNTNDRIKEMIRELVDLVGSEVQPKAMYKASHLGRMNEEILQIDGVEFFHKMKNPAFREGRVLYG